MTTPNAPNQKSRAADAAVQIEQMIAKQGFVMLDGGLATELEQHGFDLNHPLWSARLEILQRHPEAIMAVHESYLQAGAHIITAASYQATVPGFQKQGLSEQQAVTLLQKTIEMACTARDRFCDAKQTTGFRPLVAASIGPFGAYLADGSEYCGDYQISDAALRDFHLSRWHALAKTEADLFACETIPSLREAKILLELLQETEGLLAWFSFSCYDGEHISDGTPIRECAALLRECSQVVAVGANCTAPRFIPHLIAEMKREAPSMQIVVYPNSGESYDAAQKKWFGTSEPLDFANAAITWQANGAKLIGGCCRTRPAHVRAMRSALLQQPIRS